jgi:hypothetical protein
LGGAVADGHGAAREFGVGNWPLRKEAGIIEEVKGEEETRFRRGSHIKFYFYPFCRTPLEGYFGSLR